MNPSESLLSKIRTHAKYWFVTMCHTLSPFEVVVGDVPGTRNDLVYDPNPGLVLEHGLRVIEQYDLVREHVWAHPDTIETMKAHKVFCNQYHPVEAIPTNIVVVAPERQYVTLADLIMPSEEALDACAVQLALIRATKERLYKQLRDENMAHYRCHAELEHMKAQAISAIQTTVAQYAAQ